MKKMGITIVGVVLVIGCIFLLSKKDAEKVMITEEQELDNTSLVFMLQAEEGNYNKSDTLPSTGYTLNASKSVCSDNATPTWEDNKLYLNNLTKKGTSCYLYFDKKPMAMNTILANKTIDDSRSGAITGPLTENTTGTIYKSLDESQYDDDGEVYYFAGNPTDNWVQFGGFYWRIVRVNGDRSIYTGEGYGISRTFYQLTKRIYSNDSTEQASPSYYCNRKYDLYTVNESSQGNKALNYPIGLITGDEISFAGAIVDQTRINFYLNTEENYWTMSPTSVSASSLAYVFIVGFDDWHNYLVVNEKVLS